MYFRQKPLPLIELSLLCLVTRGDLVRRLRLLTSPSMSGEEGDSRRAKPFIKGATVQCSIFYIFFLFMKGILPLVLVLCPKLVRSTAYLL